MPNILGDKTILSLLDLVELEEERKQEIRDLLPKMNEDDRREVFEMLYQLFSIKVQKNTLAKQSKTLAQKTDDIHSIDWQKFNDAEKEALKEILSKQD